LNALILIPTTEVEMALDSHSFLHSTEAYLKLTLNELRMPSNMSDTERFRQYDYRHLNVPIAYVSLLNSMNKLHRWVG